MRKLFIISLILLLATSVFAQWPYDNKPMLGRQINWVHPLSKGLVGLWLFNEGSGGQASDLSGNGNIGIFVNSPIWGIGKYGQLVNFVSTSSQVISVSNAPVTAVPMTLISWVKTGAAWKYIYGVSVCNSGSEFNRHAVSCRANVSFSYNFGDTGVSGGSVVADTHYMIAGVSYAIDDHHLYVDGIEIASSSLSSIATGLDRIGIGALYDSTPSYSDGGVEMAMIYNRALSASEVALLYREMFCMFEEDNIALMAVEAPAVGGQVIIIQTMIPVFLIFTLVCFVKRRKQC